MSKIIYQSGGISFLGLLTIVFITLKLTGYIAWSWLWVLAPLWVGFAMAVLLTILFATLAFAMAMAGVRVKPAGRSRY